jgi:hypothetical protein
MTLFSRAVAALRAAGRDVRPSSVPGLTWVDGAELTVAQVIDLAGA